MSSPLLNVPQGGPVNPRWKVGDRAIVFVPHDPIADRKWTGSVNRSDYLEWSYDVAAYHGLVYEIKAIYDTGPHFSVDPCAIFKETDGSAIPLSAIPLRWLQRGDEKLSAVAAKKEIDDLARFKAGKLAHELIELKLKTQGNDLDQARVQLGGCLIAAEGGAFDAKPGGYGWSPAFEAVKKLRADLELDHDQCDKLRIKLDNVRSAIMNVETSTESNDMTPGVHGWSPALEAVKNVREVVNKLKADLGLYMNAERDLSDQVAELTEQCDALTDERDVFIRAAKEREERPWLKGLRDRIATEAKEACSVVVLLAWMIVLVAAAVAILSVDRAAWAIGLVARGCAWFVRRMTKAINVQLDMGKPFSIVSAAIGFGLAFWMAHPLLEQNERLKKLNTRPDETPVAPVNTSSSSTSKRWF